jgi:hypothetical protein
VQTVWLLIALNTGIGFIVEVSVAVSAHCPLLGVNVYVCDAALLIAGDQFPVKPSFEAEGNTKLPPSQMAVNELNVEGIPVVTITSKIAVFEHWPASGVKV